MFNITLFTTVIVRTGEPAIVAVNPDGQTIPAFLADTLVSHGFVRQVDPLAIDTPNGPMGAMSSDIGEYVENCYVLRWSGTMPKTLVGAIVDNINATLPHKVSAHVKR